jgi:hypothetical protein
MNEQNHFVQAPTLPLDQERLACEMDEGYQIEATSPSLDPEWSSFEVEGLKE